LTLEINISFLPHQINLEPKTAVARNNVRLVKLAAGSLSSRIPPPSFSNTNRVVKDVVKDRSDPGKRMMTVGTALLILPEPITGVAAVPVLILGKALSNRSGTSVKGIYEEIRKSMRAISSAETL